MELLAAICVGLGLSAAGGLRLFVPLLIAGIADRLGMVQLAPVLSWAASWPAIAILAMLCAAEGLAYCIPAVDHAMDAISAPASWLAGALLASGVVAPQLHSALSDGNGLAGFAAHAAYATGLAGTALCGMGSALATQVAGASGRVVSTSTTGGVANPLYGAFESALALAASVLAVLAPIALAVLALVVLLLVWNFLRRRTPRMA